MVPLNAAPMHPAMTRARRALGLAGEHLAERELLRRGWRILDRNARTRYGEIDLVCHDGDGYVFVEVKTRRDGAFVSAIEALTARKRGRLISLAQAWLAHRGMASAPWRVVLVAVTVGRKGTSAELVEVEA